MKKMYLAIFLIILVAVVFCGCLSFSNTLTASPTDSEGNIIPEDLTDSNGQMNPIYNIPEVPEETTPVEVTDSSGETVTIDVPSLSEFDILKHGSFYLKGTMTDSAGVTAPMEMAVTADSMFMLSDFSGASMGMLIKDGKLYMIYADKKAYLELSDSIMSMAGMDINELTGSMDGLDFSKLGNLADAVSITEEAFGGRVCQVYRFDNPDGTEKRIYMDGTKLIRMATYSSSGKFITATDIESISATVPADKAAPPSSYKAYKGVTGLFSFMGLIEDLM